MTFRQSDKEGRVDARAHIVDSSHVLGNLSAVLGNLSGVVLEVCKHERALVLEHLVAVLLALDGILGRASLAGNGRVEHLLLGRLGSAGNRLDRGRTEAKSAGGALPSSPSCPSSPSWQAWHRQQVLEHLVAVALALDGSLLGARQVVHAKHGVLGCLGNRANVLELLGREQRHRRRWSWRCRSRQSREHDGRCWWERRGPRWRGERRRWMRSWLVGWRYVQKVGLYTGLQECLSWLKGKQRCLL
ncbi:hypothetical protein BC831DRAFT_39313 [Entophlyctis helioformis]|nr:hypothetical protein BC831DRAFT_39313 [Entophlyctis helioformis]